jgi:hypothetical protein
MPDFRPNEQYIREMKRFGVLPADFDATTGRIDPFETDQRYWQLFWYHPRRQPKWPFLKQVSMRSGLQRDELAKTPAR